MSAPKIFFTSTLSMSTSMVVQNFSPIRCFLHNKWAQNMAVEEKKQKQQKKKNKKIKKKKKVGKPIGDPVGTGCPNYTLTSVGEGGGGGG